MRHYFASWVVVLSALSCGGTSETTDWSGAGSSSGGTSSGGSSSAGSATGGTAGKNSGGSTSGGTSNAGSTSGGTGTSGSTGQAGSTSGGNGSGGSGTVDPNCPPTRPMGTCDDAGTSCQYDYTNCLCYPTAPGTFIQCQKVDPACTGIVQTAPADGTGGISAKIALPPRQVCTCTAGSWMCAFGG